jgi:hypothetical protein
MEEACREIPSDTPPPFVITGKNLAAVCSDPELSRTLKAMALAPLEADLRLKAIALCAAFLDRAEDAQKLGAGPGTWAFLQNLREMWPQAFKDSDETEIRCLLGELSGHGLMTMDPWGYRFRSEQQRRFLGGPDAVLEELSGLADTPAPPDSGLLTLRRLLPALPAAAGKGAAAGASGAKDGEGPLPLPSPFTLLQEALLFAPGSPAFSQISGSIATGSWRAGAAVSSLAAMAEKTRLAFCAFGTPSELRSAAGLTDRIQSAQQAAGGFRLFVDMSADSPNPSFETGEDFAGAFRRRASSRVLRLKVTCLCLTTHFFNRAADGWRFKVPDVWTSGWSESAVKDYLSRCGLDPAQAPAIMERSGGWDCLVLSEVNRLAGRQWPEILPEQIPDGANENARRLLEPFSALWPATVPEAAEKLPKHGRITRSSLAGIMGLFVGLGILVVSGYRDGECVWRMDPRFTP